MSASPEPRRPGSGREVTRSIGQVLTALNHEFPDISISKIRFLESEGLITPQRAPSGYRRYAEHDVERLRYVLSVQREHYLPLKVIREHLEMMDRGQTPPGTQDPRVRVDLQHHHRGPGRADADRTAGRAQEGAAAVRARTCSRPAGSARPAWSSSSGPASSCPRRGGSFYGRDALTLAIAARRLGEYGIDGRHLRAFKMSADREVGLVEQAIAPYVRRAGGNTDVSGEVTQLVISFHAALVRTAMER